MMMNIAMQILLMLQYIDDCKDGSISIDGVRQGSPYEWVENITVTSLTEQFYWRAEHNNKRSIRMRLCRANNGDKYHSLIIMEAAG